jgi:hypothetical protein
MTLATLADVLQPALKAGLCRRRIGDSGLGRYARLCGGGRGGELPGYSAGLDPHAGRIRPCRFWAKMFRHLAETCLGALWWPILITAIRLKTVDLRSTAASPQ